MVTNQAYIFLIFTITGIVIGLLFDFFRVLRRSFKTKDIITYIQDVLFWILAGLILLYTVFTFSNGEIRLYMFIGIFIGCILYMLMCSKYFITINVKFIILIKKIIFILINPIKIIIKFLYDKIFKNIIIILKKFKKILKISNKKKDFSKKSRKIKYMIKTMKE